MIAPFIQLKVNNVNNFRGLFLGKLIYRQFLKIIASSSSLNLKIDLKLFNKIKLELTYNFIAVIKVAEIFYLFL